MRFSPWFKRSYGFACPATGYKIVAIGDGFEIENAQGVFILGDSITTNASDLKAVAHSDFQFERQNSPSIDIGIYSLILEHKEVDFSEFCRLIDADTEGRFCAKRGKSTWYYFKMINEWGIPRYSLIRELNGNVTINMDSRNVCGDAFLQVIHRL